MAKIAFIGLGHMGGGMAPNLAQAGHQVRAFDLSEEALNAAVEKGCGRAGSAEEAVKDADVVITMLPAAKHVLGVYRDQVLGKAPTSALLIDCSTIDVASARSIEEEAAGLGYTMVDAPVSGGIAAAASGNLAFMVGGSEDAFARAQRFLDPIVVKAGDHDCLVHAVRLKCIELAVQQAAAVEVDQALGPLVDEVAQARSLACGKNDCFHVLGAPAFQMRRRLGISMRTARMETSG